jgi:hypothetical protein
MESLLKVIAKGSRKPYSPPQLQTRTFEQAALFLTGHAWIGNQDAKDLLKLLFPTPEDRPPCGGRAAKT